MIRDLDRITIDWTEFEEASRKSLEIIHEVADNKQTLRKLVLHVAKNERLRAMCEVHEHGEVADELNSSVDDRRVQYLVIYDALDRGLRLRIFTPAVGAFNPLHNHRYSFSTRLLSGNYQHTIYQVVPVEPGQSSEWTCKQKPGTHIGRQLPVVDIADIHAAWNQEHKQGASYSMHHTTLHTSNYAAPRTFSLFMRSPAAKDYSFLGEPNSKCYWWKFSREREVKDHLSTTRMTDEQYTRMVERLEMVGAI
jgi:hypothetical protein